MSEKSNETVKRFTLEYHHTQTYAEMAPDDDGDWVRYSDYRAVLGDGMTDQLFTPRSYPNTLETERDQLRARVAELEQIVDGIYRYAVDTTVSDSHFRGWAEVEARAALNTTQEDEING